MSGDEMKIDIGRVRASAPGFRRAATQLTDAHSQLSASLQSEGKCWGADESGSEFEESYADGAEKAQEMMTKLSTAITAITDKLVATADSVEQTDTDFSQIIDKQFYQYNNGKS